jgi:hypothetical protein
MKLVNAAHDKRLRKKVLKYSKVGLETEFHLIDDLGYISNKAPFLINELQKLNENIFVTEEIGRNMVEFGCYPDINTHNPMLNMINSIEKAIEICDKKKLSLYPFSTYPGKFEPVVTAKSKYNLKKKIFGEDKFKILSRVTGFHHHYSLPKGIFDYEKKELKMTKRNKFARTLVSSYNFEIAIDPILLLFTQSSPFYQGEHLAKNCRSLVYRGGKKLKYMDGAYSKFQQIGGLQPYKQTTTDLISSINKRILRWKRIVKKADPKVDFNSLYGYKSDIGWNPVKINKHGTLEDRGMDINMLSIISGVSVILKEVLERIHRDFLEVLPADFAMDEPFKIEGGIIYVPPHTHIRNKLQPASIYQGYSNKNIYEYTKKFMNLIKSYVPNTNYNTIIPIIDMVENKCSMSDKIFKYAKHKGYLDENNRIDNESAAKLALHYADKFKPDLEKTKETFQYISGI